MKTNPLKEGALTENSAGLGTVTRKMVQERAVELAVISYIRYRYMDTPFLAATFQIVVGGVLVFLAGILIGSS